MVKSIVEATLSSVVQKLKGGATVFSWSLNSSLTGVWQRKEAESRDLVEATERLAEVDSVCFTKLH